MGQEWSSHGGYRFDRMDHCIDRHGRMNVANPTFEEMARHWFATFGTNCRCFRPANPPRGYPR
jgi:hypothetical protein